MDYKSLTREFVLKHSKIEYFYNLEKYADMIEEKNRFINLTGFSGDTLWSEGIYESLIALHTSLKNIDNKNIKMVDVGAGVGFPSVPYKIIFPEINLTIIEPIKKRIRFLEEVSRELKLNIKFNSNRAEELSGDFDLITARAVAPLNILFEITHRLGKIGAKYLFLKGPLVKDELEHAKEIASVLKINNTIRRIEDPFLGKESYLVEYTKNHPTPQGCPRKWSVIVKSKSNK